MKRLFLSYTYNPHPDFEAFTRELERYARVVIDSLDLRIVDGQDLGGRAIDGEIQQRITDCDALVALYTPWADPHGNPTTPPYVEDEYKFAVFNHKPAIRVLHATLAAQGMYQGNEYIPLDPDNPVGAVVKLMRTVAGWKRRSGTPRRVKIDPDVLGERIQQQADEAACEYQVLVDNRPQDDWWEAPIWPEPGGIYAYLPRVPEESKIRMRLTLGGERWESPFSDLHGRIELSQR
jgi:hypothetical protein